MALTVELPVFDGPLDLLLHLIDKNKINIFDIPIVEITEQYLAYSRNSILPMCGKWSRQTSASCQSSW